MRMQISGARLIDPANGVDQIADIYIQDSKIVAIGKMPRDFVAEQMIDASGLVAAPGLIDLGVSLREPGHSRKGNINSETLAAAVGGVTGLCCTPNTKPVIDSPAVVELILDRTKMEGHTRVYPIGALTQGLDGEHLAELVTLHKEGCVAFSNDLAPMANSRVLRRTLEYAASFGLTIIFKSQDHDLAEGGVAHEGPAASFRGLAGIPETAETVALARDLLLVEQSGVRAHFSNITTARGVQLIAQAQKRGLNVTADVAMYQLFLTDEVVLDFSSNYHVQPPIRSLADREALREAVKSGVVNAIASHHQPQDKDAKAAPFAETSPGISSVELLLPLGLTLVAEGVLDLPTLIARLTNGPANALKLNAGSLTVGANANLVLFDPNGTTLAGEHWYSKGRNCPFFGQTLNGKVHYTIRKGNISYQA